MKILIDRFTGMRPAVEPHLLETGEAQTALNALLETGAIEGMPPTSVLKSTTKGTVNTLWRYPGTTETQHWLEFTGRAEVVRSPVPDDVWDRIYWTDSSGVRYGPSSVVLSGGTFPASGFSLGVPIPTTAPTASSFTPGVTGFTELRAYAETFVTEYGEQGPPSPVSAIYNVDPRQPVTVSGLNPLPTPGVGQAWNLTKRRLYRTSYTGGTAAQLQRVAELPIAQLSFVDNVAQANLGAVLDSEAFEAPPTNCYGMTVTESGMMVLLRERDVFLSENYLPHAYDYEQIKRLQYKAVSAAAFEQALVITTEGDLYVGIGSTPAGTQLMRLADSQPNLSAAATVVTRGGCFYPSPIGLIAVGSDLRPTLVTKDMFTQKQWLEYNPSSFIGALHNSRLHFFFTRLDGSRGVMIIDPTARSAPLVLATQVSGQPVTAAYRDPTSDTLYVVRNGQIQRQLKSGAPLTWTWRSKEFRFPQATMLSAFVVRGDAGTVTFRTFRNGQLWSTKTLPANQVGRLPNGSRSENWTFEIEASTKVTELRVAPSVQELWV